MADSQAVQDTPRKALPASTPDVLVQIIKAFVVKSEEGRLAVAFSAFAWPSQFRPGEVQQNVPFLLDSGLLIERSKEKFSPAGPAVRFAREAAAGKEKQATAQLIRAISGVWYTDVLRAAFQSSSLVSESTLVEMLAIGAGVSPIDPGLILLIDFLLWSGLLEGPEGGPFSRGSNLPAPLSMTTPVDAVFASETNVSVVVNVSLTPADLTPENAARIREWIQRLNGPR